MVYRAITTVSYITALNFEDEPAGEVSCLGTRERGFSGESFPSHAAGG